jgi:hypothetical protein
MADLLTSMPSTVPAPRVPGYKQTPESATRPEVPVLSIRDECEAAALPFSEHPPSFA